MSPARRNIHREKYPPSKILCFKIRTAVTFAMLTVTTALKGFSVPFVTYHISDNTCHNGRQYHARNNSSHCTHSRPVLFYFRQFILPIHFYVSADADISFPAQDAAADMQNLPSGQRLPLCCAHTENAGCNEHTDLIDT